MASHIGAVERVGEYTRVTFCLAPTHGRHAGKETAVGVVVFTTAALQSLAALIP